MVLGLSGYTRTSRSETKYTPFIRAHRNDKNSENLKTYRLIVSKIERKDKQINAFTNEAYLYSAIITNDNKRHFNEVVEYYNKRGTAEREFDVLKNDFGWNNLPFSKLEQNTVFLLFSAMCRNLYQYIIKTFANKFQGLKDTFRIKKFIFRFISIPAKWIKSSRSYKLRLYGNIHFKTQNQISIKIIYPNLLGLIRLKSFQKPLKIGYIIVVFNDLYLKI